MKIISVVSGKGGVGKTTLSANLCLALKKMGQDVLSVDLDPQNSLRLHLGINPNQVAGFVTLALLNTQWDEVMLRGNQDCLVLPFGRTNETERTAFEHQLGKYPSLLLDNLNKLKLSPNTIVIIDTPPGPSVYLKQALFAANIAVVAILADAASYATLPMIDDLIGNYCHNRADFIETLYVINQLDRSRQLAGDIADIVRAKYKTENTSIIHQDQSIPESLAFGEDVISYALDSRGAQDIIDFALKISHFLDGNLNSKMSGQES